MSNSEAALKYLLLGVLFSLPLACCSPGSGQQIAEAELEELGKRQLTIGDYTKALDTAERLIALNQNDGYALYVETCFRCGDIEKAKKALHEIEARKVQLGEKKARINEISSVVWLKNGEIDRALNAATEVLTHSTSASDQSLARVTRSVAYSKKHDYRSAIRDIDFVITKSSCSPEYFYLRGTYYEELGNLKKAMQDYSSALCWDPKLPSAYQRRAAILFRSGNHQEAASELKRAREIQSDNKGCNATSLRWIPYDLEIEPNSAPLK